jgi:hypothetical protein
MPQRAPYRSVLRMFHHRAVAIISTAFITLLPAHAQMSSQPAAKPGFNIVGDNVQERANGVLCIMA